MDVDIEFDGDITNEDSYELKKLAEALGDSLKESVCVSELPLQRGKKDGGLIIGIAVAALAVNSIGTLFSVFSYWNSIRPKYTVTASRGNSTITFGNLSQKRFLEIIETFKASGGTSHIKVLISRK